MRIGVGAAWLWAVACTGEPSGKGDISDAVADADRDGFAAGVDCDDQDPAIHPEAEELCNNLDDNCNELVDDQAVDSVEVWADDDADGFGAEGEAVPVCTAAANQVSNQGDCDDSSAAVNPAALEQCNDADDDCDGLIDDADDNLDPASAVTRYPDSDGDGYGDVNDPGTLSCSDGAGVTDHRDCDDTNPATYPGAAAVDGVACTTDSDGDGYGDANPASGVTAGADCDDSERTISPGSPEVIDDGLDNNCDGYERCATDQDEDGYAPLSGATIDSADLDCDDPGETGLSAPETDCDDLNGDVSPATSETCNRLDDDCDGLIDDADPGVMGSTAWYGDADLDGYGDAATVWWSCYAPAGTVADATDCDDSTYDIHPGAAERCDGLDDDCDGLDDAAESALGTLAGGEGATWYVDADGDGAGDAAAPRIACDAADGTVADAGDCDDSNSAISPSATEVCNGLDDDCDGLADDDGAEGTTTFYADTDGDGAGDADNPRLACTLPAGFVGDPNDCDDLDASIHPAAVERCNAVDDDCDGVIDDADPDVDLSTASAWYADVDLDGAGDPADEVWACGAPDGYVDLADLADGDCDDTASDVYPGAPEACNEADDDCDGLIDIDDPDFDRSTLGSWYDDDDGDGHGAGAASVSCTALPGTVAGDADCDDTDAAISPDATEVCNGDDDDCDGLTDDDDLSLDTASTSDWHPDADRDGYGDEASVVEACEQPVGTLSAGDDCDDGDEDVSPAASEVCNGIDDDCDGRTDDNDPSLDRSTRDTHYLDSDRDGYGNSGISTAACSAPLGTVAVGGDCDDYLASVNPGATEVCNNDDDDCDGFTDDIDPSLDASSATTWYADADEDGFGDSADATRSCDAPAGYIEDNSDCDDALEDTWPGATELCDAVDNDCDGTLPADEADADGDGYAICEGDTDDTDASVVPEVSVVVGNHTTSYTAASYYRANVYLASDTVDIAEVEQYLGLASNCYLGWYLYSATSTSGTRTLLWSSRVYTLAGTGYASSGPISGVTTTPGMYYILGVGWECTATYSGQSGSSLPSVDLGFGYFAVNAWSNTYTGYSLGFVPSGTGSSSLAYEQRISYAP